MHAERIGAPARPISLAAAKAHLRVDTAAEDADIDLKLYAALQAVSESCGLVLGAEEWRVSLPVPAGGDVVLPVVPVTAVTSLSYLDRDGASQALDLTGFDVILRARRAIIRPKPGGSWPTDAAARPDALTVLVAAGISPLPFDLQAAVLLMLGHLYQQREAVAVGVAVSEVPLAVDSLIAAHRQLWVAA